MKECPRCGEKLGYSAKACKCGWKERDTKSASTEPTKPHIQCAHMECMNDATIKEHTPTGWANLCYQHMIQHANDRARQHCESIGLKTVADCRAWLRENKLLVKRAPVRQREPGDDDE